MTNAEARFNNSLRPRKPEGSLGRTAQDVHLDSHTAPELWCVSVAWGLPGISLLNRLPWAVRGGGGGWGSLHVHSAVDGNGVCGAGPDEEAVPWI